MSLSPPSTLLIGPGGTGKTTSLVTLLAEGLHVRMLATEPSAPNRVLEECAKRKISSEQLRLVLHLAPPRPSGRASSTPPTPSTSCP